MAREVGDLWPQSSGSASLGQEMTNGGFTKNAPRPFASVHQNSGVWYSGVGQSGIIRFTLGLEKVSNSDVYGNYPGFELSTNGGDRFLLKLGALAGSGAFIPNGAAIVSAMNGSQLRLTGSGIQLDSNGTVIVQGTANEIHRIAGILSLTADTMTENITNDISSNATNEFITVSNDYSLRSTLGNISFETQSDKDGEGNYSVNMLGDVIVHAYNHSGQLHYNFGPYQSWYITTSDASTGGPFNDGGWPIAHSGHVKQMIGLHGLQGAYNAGRVAVITTSPGDLQFVSNTAKTRFSTFGTQAELNLSGLFFPPTQSNLVIGDMFMMNHGVISGMVPATTTAITAAQSLGHGTPVVHTGSGMINVSVGSGVAMFINDSLQKITTAMETVSLNVASEAADQNYGIGTGLSSGILKVFSPGLYKVSYHIVASKTVGATLQVCNSRLEKNSSGNAIPGTSLGTNHGAVGAAVVNATASNVIIINLDAGDTLRLRINSTNSGANNCDIPINGANLVIEKIGPKRGAAGS